MIANAGRMAEKLYKIIGTNLFGTGEYAPGEILYDSSNSYSTGWTPDNGILVDSRGIEIPLATAEKYSFLEKLNGSESGVSLQAREFVRYFIMPESDVTAVQNS